MHKQKAKKHPVGGAEASQHILEELLLKQE